MNGTSVGETMIINDRKVVILSMDIEEWCHLDYLDTSNCNISYSMLDGIDINN